MRPADGGGGATITVSVPSGDASALIGLADELDSRAESLSSLSSTLDRTTTSIAQQADWTGSAASAYEAFAQSTATGVAGLAAPLHKIAAAIRTYATSLLAQQQSVTSAIGDADRVIGSAAEQQLASAAESAASAAGDAVNAAAAEAVKTILAEKDALDKVMEATDPVRSWLEKVHLPWDLGGGLAFEKLLAKPAEDVVKAGEDLSKLWDSVESLAHDADNGLVGWDDVDQLAARFSSLQDAAKAFTPGWLETAAKFSTELGGLSKAMGVLGIVGDVGTIWKPEDSGALGVVDRSAAVINAGAIGTDLLAANALDEMPVVGEVVMVADVATGLYLGTDYVIHHWAGISHGAETAAKAVGHAAVSVAQGAAHTAESAVHTASHVVSDVTSWL